MNKVSPILEDNSAASLQLKVQLQTKPDYFLNQYEGPKVCKICLDEEEVNADQNQQEKKQNQFIIPCQCRGSVGFVHQKCIKMWIQKQMQTNKAKRAFCQICKSEIFFEKIKIDHCDCQLKNCCQTSPSNIICIIGQIVLIAVIGVVEYYVDRLMNFLLLRNALLVILGILGATLLLTILLILREVFVKTNKQIQKIYSLVESEQLGFRQPRQRQEEEANRKVIKNRIAHNQECQRRIVLFGSIRQAPIEFS